MARFHSVGTGVQDQHTSDGSLPTSDDAPSLAVLSKVPARAQSHGAHPYAIELLMQAGLPSGHVKQRKVQLGNERVSSNLWSTVRLGAVKPGLVIPRSIHWLYSRSGSGSEQGPGSGCGVWARV